MFTIEQAGHIKKENTIDELIIEYIRMYACKCNGNNSGGNLNAEELKNHINDTLRGVATEEYVNQVIANIDLSAFVTRSELESYVTHTILEDSISAFATKDELNAAIPDIPKYNVMHKNMKTKELQLSTKFDTSCINGFNANIIASLQNHSIDIKGNANINDAIIDISGVYNFKSFDNDYIIYALESDSSKRIAINTRYYDGTIFYRDERSPAQSNDDTTPLNNTNLTSFGIMNMLTTEFDDNDIPSMRYLTNAYELKTDIPTLPDNIVDNDTLATTLNDYAKAQDLQSYATKTELADTIIINNDNTITEQLEIDKNATYSKTDVIKHVERYINKFPISTLHISAITDDDVKLDISGTYTFTRFDNEFWYLNKSDSEQLYIRYYRYDGDVYYNNSTYVDISEASIIYKITGDTQFESNVAPSMNYLLHNYTTTTDLENNYYTKSAAEEQFVNEDELAEELQKYATKTEIPTNHVTTDQLTSTLATYALKTEQAWTINTNNKLIPVNNNDVIINKLAVSELNIGSSVITSIKTSSDNSVANDASIPTTGYINKVTGSYLTKAQTDELYAPKNSDKDDDTCMFKVDGSYIIPADNTKSFKVDTKIKTQRLTLSRDSTEDYLDNFLFESGITSLDSLLRGACLDDRYDIYFSKYTGGAKPLCTLRFNKDGTIGADSLYTLDGDKYITDSDLVNNTTITHYCPIESDLNAIDDFIIGAPVYMTGKVYRYDKSTKRFIPSTETDTTDCICSVKTTGSWYEYVGICVKIDVDNKCVTFSTHGDYMVRVTDTSCYAIGDEVFIDNGELKTLTGQTAITSKIHRTTIGIITSIISKKILAVFKA